MPEITKQQRVYDGKLIQVDVVEETRDGGGVQQREVVHHKPGVAIVVMQEHSDVVVYGYQVIMVEHYRTPIGVRLTELVAGMVDEGETPLEAAKRELGEEVGLEAGQWDELGTLYTSPGFTDEAITLYLARDVRGASAKTDEKEQLSLCMVPFALALEQVRKGEIQDMKTVAGLLWTSYVLEEERNE